jgi:hypothetical protein
MMIGTAVSGQIASPDPLGKIDRFAEPIEFAKQSQRTQADTLRGFAAQLYAERRKASAVLVDAQTPLQLEEIIVEGKRMPKELQLKKSDPLDPLRRALAQKDRTVTEEVHTSGNVSLCSGSHCTCFRNYARNVALPQSGFKVFSVAELGNCN